MPGTDIRECPPLVVTLGGPTGALVVDLGIYELPAVLRACYQLSDRCYFFLRQETAETVTVFFQNRAEGSSLEHLSGQLVNEMLDQQVRENLAREAKPLRDLIAAQAFSEGNLLDEDRDEGDYREDPLGIGRVG